MWRSATELHGDPFTETTFGGRLDRQASGVDMSISSPRPPINRAQIEEGLALAGVLAAGLRGPYALLAAIAYVVARVPVEQHASPFPRLRRSNPALGAYLPIA